MFQGSSNHAHLNHCCIQTATSSINKDQPRKKTLSATVTSLDNNAGCEDSISCVDKNQSNTIMKRATKDLSNNSKVNARYRNDNTRIAAEDVLVPSSTCTRQNLKVTDSRVHTLNPQCSYKPVAVAKSDAESGNPSRVNIFAVVFQILKVCFLTSLLFSYSI